MNPSLLVAVSILALAALSGPSHASEPAKSLLPYAAAAELDDDALADQRARGDEPFQTKVIQDASIKDATIGSSVTGSNTISLSDFAGQGFFLFTQNTGNQVVFQNAFIVNILVH